MDFVTFINVTLWCMQGKMLAFPPLLKHVDFLGSLYFSLFVGLLCLSLFCYALLCVHSSFAIVLKRMGQLDALLLLSYRCLVTVNVLLHRGLICSE